MFRMMSCEKKLRKALSVDERKFAPVDLENLPCLLRFRISQLVSQISSMLGKLNAELANGRLAMCLGERWGSPVEPPAV